jgi:hypothetical protein
MIFFRRRIFVGKMMSLTHIITIYT